MPRFPAAVLFPLAALVLLTAPRAARANDTWVAGVSGSARLAYPSDREHGTVRMVRETVRMDLYPEHYDTRVTFTFANNGPATTVAMGFPETGYVGTDVETAARYRQTFKQFRTSVDGKPVAARRTRAGVRAGMLDALWVKVVPFAANQTRTVEVRYRSPYGQTSVHGLSRFASYHFTGKNWRGKVAESRLEVTSHMPGHVLVHAQASDARGEVARRVALRRDGAAANRGIHVWRDWEAQTEFSLALATAPDGWVAGKDGKVPGIYELRAADVQTLSLPEPAGPRNRYHYLPPAFRRGGVTYAALTRLEELGIGGAVAAFDGATKTASVTVGGHRLSFPRDGKTVTVDGKALPTPAPPVLMARAWMSPETLYVPLEPIAGALGRTAAVDEKARRLTLTPRTTAALPRP